MSVFTAALMEGLKRVREMTSIQSVMNNTKAQFQAGLQSMFASGIRIAAAAAIGYALFKLVSGALEEAKEAQNIAAQTEAVIESTRGAAGITADEVNRIAMAFQETTTYSDDAVASVENLLLTFMAIDSSIFEETTGIVLDLSTALGQDLKSSSIQVGKALQDPIRGVTALRRVGVAFGVEQQAQIARFVESGNLMKAQRMILDELSREFGGSASKAAETFAGKQEQLANQFRAVQESIGMVLLPILTALGKAFMWIAGPILGAMQGNMASTLTILTALFIVRPLGALFISLGKAIQFVGTSVEVAGFKRTGSALGGLAGKVTAVAGTVSKFAGALGLAVTGGVLLYEGLGFLNNRMRETQRETRQASGTLVDEFLKAAVIAGASIESLTEKYDELAERQTQVFIPGTGWTDTGITIDEAAQAEGAMSLYEQSILGVAKAFSSGKIDMLDAKEALIATGVPVQRATQYLKYLEQQAHATGDEFDTVWEAMSQFAGIDFGSVNVDMRSLIESAQDMNNESGTMLKDWYQWAHDAVLQAKQAMADFSGQAADSILGVDNAFSVLGDTANLTKDKIVNAFRAWQKGAQSFGEDLVKIAKRSPELAQEIMSSGNAALADFLANHQGTLNTVSGIYDKTKDSAQNFGETLAKKLLPPLKSIKRLLVAIAGEYDIELDLNVGGTGPWRSVIDNFAANDFPGSSQWGGQRAAGGWVGTKGPEVVLVGEEGPEFIVPNSDLSSFGAGNLGMQSPEMLNKTRKEIDALNDSLTQLSRIKAKADVIVRYAWEGVDPNSLPGLEPA